MVAAPRILLVLALVVSGCGTASDDDRPRADAQAATTTPGPPDRRALIRAEHLPNVALTTHDGRTVRFYDDLVRDKVVAINFMYATCRGSCPASTEHLALVQKLLAERVGHEVTFLSITLDPERDTPEVLRGYAEAHDVGPGWLFLTGRPDDIELLRHKLGAYDPDPTLDADRSQHSGLVILGNEPRARWRAISALSQPVRIRQAIERTILPPSRWATGAAVVDEVPYEVSESTEPVDLSDIPDRP